MSTRRQFVQHRTVSTHESSVSEKPRTPLEHLKNGWIPVNHLASKLLQDRIKKGDFNTDRDALISEIKKDFGLLSYIFHAVSKDEDFVENPMKLMQATSLDELDRIIDEVNQTVTIHSFVNSLKPQSLRFRHSVISCVTAESLAQSQGLDPDLAYSVAMLRQLGLSLVAFNYPRIYAKAISTLASVDEDIETLLHRGLGFSPRHLAAKLTLGDPSPDLKIALGLETAVPETVSLGTKLAAISTLSEAYAEMNDPEHYPAVTRKWKSITQNLEDIIGASGVANLQKKCRAISSNYTALPYLGLEGELSIEKNLEIANRKHAEAQFLLNPDASKISEDIQYRLKRTYALARPHEVSPEALQSLVIDCIPYAGFKRGCVFLLDPVTQNLIPRLRIGQRTLLEYKAFSVASAQGGNNPILEAMQSNIPIKRDDAVIFGERVSAISGMIGNGEKGGVLYLELDEDLAKIGGFEPVLRFKAIRHCLNQCLNLKSGNYA